MSERSTWVTTTHDWAQAVDRSHLKLFHTVLADPDVSGGCRHLILEVLAYAQDEAAAAKRIGAVTVTYGADGSVSVADDGRGTDTRRDDQGIVIRKPVMSTPDVRFLDASTAPMLPDGLPRRGMSSVAAVSSILTHENHRDTGSWSQTYRFGLPDAELASIEPRKHSGTTVTFRAELQGPRQLTTEDLKAFPDIRITTV